MPEFVLEPAVPADAAAVAELVRANEEMQYGRSAYARADLEDEWAHIDLAADTRVAREGERVVGYAAIRDRGETADVEAYAHRDERGRGIGRSLASWLEQDAARTGARRIHNTAFENDAAAAALLRSMGYERVRVFREMRIRLDAPPPSPALPQGLRVVAFDPDRDARAVHAAHQEAFADHWDHTPRGFADWAKHHLEGERFDPSLWCVVRDGDEIAAGTISTADTYGGGWIHAVFTRRPWRGRGVGAALLHDAFGRLWSRGERDIGLGVDAASRTGAFRLYERAGMTPAIGWAVFEKALG